MIQPLRSRASFDALSASGRRTRGHWCWVRFAPLPDDLPPFPYVGYAIGRKVGPAVVRNRIRRRLRAILAAPDVRLDVGLYLVGVNDAQTATMDFITLRDDLSAVLARSTRD
ncbi:MAG: ribonuclease P protein component [Actinomycetota bacterium]